MNKEKFGEFVCKLRKEKGMTQQDLGDKLHLTNKAISKWERGLSFPDICIFQNVAQTLDISVLELLNGERNTEISISNEAANRIIEDTVKHSEKIIKKIRKKLTIVISLSIGLFPLLLMFFSQACFYLIKDEKSLDEALLTLAFITFTAALVFIKYGISILGFIFTRIWYCSKLMSSNKKLKKIICVVLCLAFGMYLAINVARVIKNIVP